MPAAPNGIFPRNGVPANQAAPGAQIGVDATCDELFYAARCNPRVDIQSLNTIISEIVNAVNCAGLTYDCDELDNLCRAMRRISNDAIFDCLEGTFPNANEACGDVQYVILSTNAAGCQRFALYNPAGPARGQGIFRDAQPALAPDQNYTLPDDFTAGYYNFDDLQADYAAGTINEATILSSLLANVQMTLTCQQRFNMVTFLWVNQPNTAQEAFERQMRIGYRWRVNGGPWTYSTQGGQFSTGLPINALELNQQWEHTNIILPAGAIEFQTFYVGQQGRDPVRLNANTYVGPTPVPTPRTQARPAL